MTARAQRRALVRAAWIKARATAHPTIAHLAVATGMDASHVARWESDRADHPVPLDVLADPAVVSEEMLDELVVEVRRIRGTQPQRAVLGTPEGALSVALQRAADTIGRGVAALADGSVTADERRALRPMLSGLSTALRTVLRVWDAADAGSVVPMRRAAR